MAVSEAYVLNKLSEEKNSFFKKKQTTNRKSIVWVLQEDNSVHYLWCWLHLLPEILFCRYRCERCPGNKRFYRNKMHQWWIHEWSWSGIKWLPCRNYSSTVSAEISVHTTWALPKVSWREKGDELIPQSWKGVCGKHLSSLFQCKALVLLH